MSEFLCPEITHNCSSTKCFNTRVANDTVYATAFNMMSTSSTPTTSSSSPLPLRGGGDKWFCAVCFNENNVDDDRCFDDNCNGTKDQDGCKSIEDAQDLQLNREESNKKKTKKKKKKSKTDMEEEEDYDVEEDAKAQSSDDDTLIADDEPSSSGSEDKKMKVKKKKKKNTPKNNTKKDTKKKSANAKKKSDNAMKNSSSDDDNNSDNNNSDDNNSDNGASLQPFAVPPTYTDLKSSLKVLNQLQQQITSITSATEGPVVDFRIIHKLVKMAKHFQQVVKRIIDNESIKPEATEGLEQSLDDIISKVYKVGITQEKLEESTPEEIVAFINNNQSGCKLPHLLSAALNHSLSKDIMCWSEDGKSFTVNITDRGRGGRWPHNPHAVAQQRKKKQDFQDLMRLFGLSQLAHDNWACDVLTTYHGFERTNHTGDNYSFRHACFDRYKPELLFRMISVQDGSTMGRCESCREKKLLIDGHCAACAGENENNVPLADLINETHMADTKEEILSKMKKHAATKSTVTKSCVIGPVMKLPEEVLKDPKMKWFLDTYGRKGDGSASNYPSYDEYELIVKEVTGMTRDEIDNKAARVPSSQLIQHYSQHGRTKGPQKLHYRFTSSMIKYGCGGCYLCGAKYDPNKPNEMHFDHYRDILREEYMLPSQAIHLSTDALRFQLPYTMLVCTRCHDFGTTRLWKLNKAYECVLSYSRQPMTISQVFDSQVFRKVEDLLLTPDFLYGGIQPKISSEKLSYLLYKITGFVASDLVTYMNPPSEEDQEPDVWDKRPRLDMGSYIVTDILYNLTKKMQGECCGDNCGADIANEPPFKLSHFHGSHSEQGAVNKGFNPGNLRTQGWKKGKKELLKLKGFECAGCHYKGSDDWGSWGSKK